MTPPMSPGERLLRQALQGVRIIVCGRCRGLGMVGLESLRIACPKCGGCGETTNGLNIMLCDGELA